MEVYFFFNFDSLVLSFSFNFMISASRVLSKTSLPNLKLQIFFFPIFSSKSLYTQNHRLFSKTLCSMKGDESMLYDLIYIHFYNNNNKNSRDKKQFKQKVRFYSNGNIPYLDCSDGYTDIFVHIQT